MVIMFLSDLPVLCHDLSPLIRTLADLFGCNGLHPEIQHVLPGIEVMSDAKLTLHSVVAIKIAPNLKNGTPRARWLTSLPLALRMRTPQFRASEEQSS
jgi:hypothetical protein